MKKLIKLGFVLIILMAFAHPILANGDKNKPPPSTIPESILKEVDHRIEKSGDDLLKEVGDRIKSSKVFGVFMAGLATIVAIIIAMGVYILIEWIVSEKAIEVDPNNANAWSNMSAMFNRLGRYDDAVSADEKAIEIGPNNESARYNRACAHSLKGEKKKALNVLKKAIELDSKCKQQAREDDDFKSLWGDADFKKLTE
ncbi:MAG: tetratricopeptide repeat protein [Deltaproteobacteria bacterium]|nr:tetratricopeptide repeat protein [Deltaproteobacteria bacterium]